MLPKERKNAQILLKSQQSAQECWKVLRKSAQRNRDMPVHIMSPFNYTKETR